MYSEFIANGLIELLHKCINMWCILGQLFNLLAIHQHKSIVLYSNIDCYYHLVTRAPTKQLQYAIQTLSDLL